MAEARRAASAARSGEPVVMVMSVVSAVPEPPKGLVEQRVRGEPHGALLVRRPPLGRRSHRAERVPLPLLRHPGTLGRFGERRGHGPAATAARTARASSSYGPKRVSTQLAPAAAHGAGSRPYGRSTTTS